MPKKGMVSSKFMFVGIIYHEVDSVVGRLATTQKWQAKVENKQLVYFVACISIDRTAKGKHYMSAPVAVEKYYCS